MRKTNIIFLLIFPMLVSNAWATGWNDYRLDIGDGYSIIKANSLDICLAESNGSILLRPLDFEHMGPIVGYYSNDSVILTKNAGRNRRNLFDGDTFEEADYTAEFFFIFEKDGKSLRGPFQKLEFQKNIFQLGINHFDWSAPKNPNFWRPLIGGLFCLSLAIPILTVKHYYVSIPVIAIFIYGLRAFFKRRKTEPKHSL
jgi:hypothetical protein